jgi:hypothetical protein
VDPGPFFYILVTIYYLLVLFTFSQTTIFYHTIRLILCLQQTGEIDNLTISWGKVLGCVVCRFHVAAGIKLRPRRGAIYKLSRAAAKLASINLRKLVLSPTGSINLSFILREDLLLCSSYLPLGVPNWAVIYTPSLPHPAIRWWRPQFPNPQISGMGAGPLSLSLLAIPAAGWREDLIPPFCRYGQELSIMVRRWGGGSDARVNKPVSTPLPHQRRSLR